MAIRPVFISSDDKEFVHKQMIEFQWFPGFAVVQKQRSIASLHQAFLKKQNKELKVLEISSKSKQLLGVALSAFNLMIEAGELGKKYSIESAFQSSKVFEKGGPFKDLLEADSRTAKKDERLRNSGKLIAFEYLGERWGLEPKTLFYDWLYIKALSLEANKRLAEEIVQYDAFTDIEFNPEKSINCQARAAALYVSLYRQGLLERAVKDRESYMSIVKEDKEDYNQLSLEDISRNRR